VKIINEDIFDIHEKNDFVEVSKNLPRYRFKNNFVKLSKYNYVIMYL